MQVDQSCYGSLAFNVKHWQWTKRPYMPRHQWKEVVKWASLLVVVFAACCNTVFFFAFQLEQTNAAVDALSLLQTAPVDNKFSLASSSGGSASGNASVGVFRAAGALTGSSKVAPGAAAALVDGLSWTVFVLCMCLFVTLAVAFYRSLVHALRPVGWQRRARTSGTSSKDSMSDGVPGGASSRKSVIGGRGSEDAATSSSSAAATEYFENPLRRAISASGSGQHATAKAGSSGSDALLVPAASGTASDAASESLVQDNATGSGVVTRMDNTTSGAGKKLSGSTLQSVKGLAGMRRPSTGADARKGTWMSPVRVRGAAYASAGGKPPGAL